MGVSMYVDGVLGCDALCWSFASHCAIFELDEWLTKAESSHNHRHAHTIYVKHERRHRRPCQTDVRSVGHSYEAMKYVRAHQQRYNRHNEDNGHNYERNEKGLLELP